MNYTRDFRNLNGMASQERAYLEPPCLGPLYVKCTYCGNEVLEEDAYQDDYWSEEDYFCDRYCEQEAWEDLEVEE